MIEKPCRYRKICVFVSKFSLSGENQTKLAPYVGQILRRFWGVTSLKECTHATVYIMELKSVYKIIIYQFIKKDHAVIGKF